MRSGCRKRRRHRDKVSLLRDLAKEPFTVFGRDDDEPVAIVERLLELAK